MALVMVCGALGAACRSAAAPRPPTVTADATATPASRPVPSPPATVRPASYRPRLLRSRTVTPVAHGAGPLPGMLLIADKGNNRLLLVNTHRRVVWQYPGNHALPPGHLFLIPDDAFFTPDHRSVIVTEEDYHVVREIDVRTGRIVWQYGHSGIPGSLLGYLDGPDDAYWVRGLITVADIRNCRILVLNAKERIVRSYGRTDVCIHDPPRAFAAPNGDTPLPKGGMLVSEIGGSWIDRLDAHGRLVWAMHSPLSYPSDPQPLPGGKVLVCDYTFPGRVVELTRRGRILASFGAASGPNLLNHPSLAIRLPNGLVALNDDWNHRVIIVDMRARRIVWQYGVTGVRGSAPGFLDNPDGIDFLPGRG